MTKEEKQLLLKDLCARLPYNVKVKVECGDIPYAPTILSKLDIKRKVALFNFEVKIENCKPYLRPMSSMTEEEKEELVKEFWGSHTAKDTFEESSWYLSKHFDINELIPRGLAIEVTENNNPYKE